MRPLSLCVRVHFGRYVESPSRARLLTSFGFVADAAAGGTIVLLTRSSPFHESTNHSGRGCSKQFDTIFPG